MAEGISGVVWCVVFFAFGFGFASFIKRKSEKVEEVSGTDIILNKISEQEKKTEDACKRLEEENNKRCKKNIEETEKKAAGIIQSAKDEAESIKKRSLSSIRQAFRDSVLILQHLVREKISAEIKGDDEKVKEALKIISDSVVAAGKTITWKGSSFKLESAETGGISIEAEDISTLALRLLEPGLQKNLPTPEEVLNKLQG